MLLETRYARLTYNVITPPKIGSQRAMPSYLINIYFHNENFTLGIKLIVVNVENGHIFYIIGYGMYV